MSNTIPGRERGALAGRPESETTQNQRTTNTTNHTENVRQSLQLLAQESLIARVEEDVAFLPVRPSVSPNIEPGPVLGPLLALSEAEQDWRARAYHSREGLKIHRRRQEYYLLLKEERRLMWLFYCLDRVRKAEDVQGLTWLYNKIELECPDNVDVAICLETYWDDEATLAEAIFGMWLALWELFTDVTKFMLAVLDAVEGDVS